MEDRIQGINEQIEALQSELKLEHDKRDKAALVAQDKAESVRNISKKMIHELCPEGWTEFVAFPHGIEFFRFCDSQLELLRWGNKAGWVRFDVDDLKGKYLMLTT